MNNVPNIKGSVNDLFKIYVENNNPVTGTISVAVDMHAPVSILLASFTAQKQKAVASGPRYKQICQKEGLLSPVKGPSNQYPKVVNIGSSLRYPHRNSL